MHDAGAGAPPRAMTDDEFEREVAALAHAPTGSDLELRDALLLGFLGVVVPAALLVWGWV